MERGLAKLNNQTGKRALNINIENKGVGCWQRHETDSSMLGCSS